MAQGYDNSCFTDIFLYECGPIYSNVVPVTIEPPPPAIVVKSVRSVRRHVTVQWTLSPTAEVWGVQLSRSGALDNSHNLRSRVVWTNFGDARKRSTSYRTPGKLNRGTYYVLVYGYDLGEPAYAPVRKVIVR